MNGAERQRGYQRDSRVLAEIGRCLVQAPLPKIEVRLPRHLAEQAVAAWERDDGGSKDDQEPDEQRRQRHRAATLALIGLSITQHGRWDGGEAVVSLDPAFIGMAINAADDLP